MFKKANKNIAGSKKCCKNDKTMPYPCLTMTTEIKLP